jgi:hypothetical protein
VADPVQFKRGDTFEFLLTVPTDYVDGFWLEWDVTSQIRTPRGKLIADLTATWEDPAEDTRVLRLFYAETTGWPVGLQEVDVQFTKTSDDTVRSTQTLIVDVVKDVTQP